MRPDIQEFFDPDTFSWTYVVREPGGPACAVIDPVLDYDPASSTVSTGSADGVIEYIRRHDLQVQWILETHVHADHLSAGSYLRDRLGGQLAIGERVTAVQDVFGDLFGAEQDFARDGSQFDRLFADGDRFEVGTIGFEVLATPGHTPACVTYRTDGAAFVGDTIFMPDFGTARTDFPGGDARTLYRSLQRILALPDETTLYMCHDYGSEERGEFAFRCTVAEQRRDNRHVGKGVSEEEFVALRSARDAELAAPRLLLPSVQFNMRGGRLPPPDPNGMHYFRIPVRSA